MTLCLFGLSLVAGLLVMGPGPQATASQSFEGRDLAWFLPGDGYRYVAFKRADEVPVVFDARDQVVREISGADGCRPSSVGGGRVLLWCDSQDFPGDQDVEPVRIASVRGGASWPFRYFDPDLDFGPIGKYWVGFEVRCQGGQCGEPGKSYMNLRTGKSRTSNSRSYYDYRDVNSPDLAPLRWPRFLKQIEGNQTYRFCYNRNVVVTQNRNVLRLWRSSTDSIRIGRTPEFGDCFEGSDFRISSGIITWASGKTIHAVSIRTSRKVRLKTPTYNPSVTPVRGGFVTAVRKKRSDVYRVRFIRLKSK